jgi:hypothetical protein
MTLRFDFVLALAAAVLAPGLYMMLPGGHKRLGVVLTAVGGLLFVYALIMLRYAPTFSLEMAQLELRESERQIGGLSRHPGTHALAIVRVQNRGETNSLLDWRFTAATTSGDHFDGVLFGMIPPSALFRYHVKDMAHPDTGDFTLDATEQIVTKTEQPMVNGEWKIGFIVFIFPNVPIETLQQTGNRFTLKCKDVVHHADITTEMVWTGAHGPLAKYPGLKYLPRNFQTENSK